MVVVVVVAEALFYAARARSPGERYIETATERQRKVKKRCCVCVCVCVCHIKEEPTRYSRTPTDTSRAAVFRLFIGGIGG
uniref:Putative secreted protein n=1 Tax=Anopheles darlingi TaxID=43151 RepID=A0A2M4DML6_ANODA